VRTERLEDRSQAGAAAYNAAVNYLRARDVPKAESYADRAALDTEHADKVEELRKLIRERR
jgi:hypothetical protein